MTDRYYDVAVVGGGHSGIEAALSASRMGCHTVMITMSVDTIGLMPCNPSIGGPAKGQIVGEIDALGGEMGRAADETMMQMRILNRSRGPAVQCLRSQNDKYLYKGHMKAKVMSTDGLDVIEGLVDDILTDDGRVTGIVLQNGETIRCKALVVTTGTFLKGLMHTGFTNQEGGRVGEKSAVNLSDAFRRLGLRLGRLKTGTPPRLHHDSIDYSQMVLQPGDPECLRFSFRTPVSDRYLTQAPCYLTHTTTATHDIILGNLDKSPMFAKVIKGLGPRYCPSIEDKVFRFKDKDSHQIFIEPEGWDTMERYPQGLNTSMPLDIQDQFLRTIPGLENVAIIRPGYAVEYDFIYPNQLHATLEARAIKNLFFAGQLNGTSGYEEAAGQGILAGINAGARVLGKPEFILKREESFIGTMADDLITKEITEPYRMMTSRSEYRLLIRQDNAIFRLGERAYEYGLISDVDIAHIRAEKDRIQTHISRWKKSSIKGDLMASFGLKQAMPYLSVFRRPEVGVETLIRLGLVTEEDRTSAQQALIEIKYEGYIDKQSKDIDKVMKYESKRIPADFDFYQLKGLKKESMEQFNRHRPETIYHAKRIAGINPADIMILIGYFERYRMKSAGDVSRGTD
jgi:tRNA uridine 5-carboxymethylaminomethyl modification enzyme